MVSNVNLGIKRVAFFGLDGVLIRKQPNDMTRDNFIEAAGSLLDIDHVDEKFNMFCEGKKEFLGECSTEIGNGTYDNFARLLEDSELFSRARLKDYERFIRRYVTLEASQAKSDVLYDDAFAMLKKLQSEGYMLYLYYRWFEKVKDAKLEATYLDGIFDEILTIENSMVRSSTNINGWENTFYNAGIRDNDSVVMIGSDKSDIIPSSLRRPTVILNHDKEPFSGTLPDNVISQRPVDILSPEFIPNIEEMSKMLRKVA